MKKKGKTKRYKKEFTDADIDSQVQEFRRGAKEEHPDENEEVFPNDAVELRDYILTLEENIKHKPTDQLREELRVYKGYQTGWYKGVCFTYEYFIAEKEKERVREEDKIANKVYDKKLIAYIKKQDPKRDISKDELLTKASSKILLTRKDLEKAGIQNIGRYLHLVDDEPKKKKRKKK